MTVRNTQEVNWNELREQRCTHLPITIWTVGRIMTYRYWNKRNLQFEWKTWISGVYKCFQVLNSVFGRWVAIDEWMWSIVQDLLVRNGYLDAETEELKQKEPKEEEIMEVTVGSEEICNE